MQTGEDPGRANEFIAIFHPEMHEMGLFTLTFSKNKIVLSDGEQERKINWRKREQISFPGIPLVILLEKKRWWLANKSGKEEFGKEKRKKRKCR